MQDWSDGYMTEVAYIFGYSPELNPLRARRRQQQRHAAVLQGPGWQRQYQRQ